MFRDCIWSSIALEYRIIVVRSVVVGLQAVAELVECCGQFGFEAVHVKSL